MIVATVRNGELERLRGMLSTMNQSVGIVNPNNTLVPFARFDKLHFARFVIIESSILDEIKHFGVTPRPWQPALGFIGDCDGERDAFFAELAELTGVGLRELFACCEDFDPGKHELISWMKRHDVKPAANYVNWLGRTVRQAHEEAALHRCLAEYLPRLVTEFGSDNPRALRQKLLSHVEREKSSGRLMLTPEAPTPRDWAIRNLAHKIGIPLALLVLLPLLLILAPFFFWHLRSLEKTDPELFIRPRREHIQALAALEDHGVTNQFTVFGDIKPGLFRRFTFKFLMLLTNYIARHIFNRGFLTRIRTIHFARWVFIDNNHRAFFVSNYDGSHEAYMDDFINKAGWGLNLAFGNAVGYPTTEWLVKQGAEREQQFKYTQRRHQIPTQVWYKAYPGLTAADLARNSRIRHGVEIRQSSDDAIRAWLSEI